MAGLIGFGALAAFATAVFLTTRVILKHLVPQGARRWSALPVAAVLAVLPFGDELYYEQQTRLACKADGGFVVSRTIFARSREAGIAEIQTVKLDTEEAAGWPYTYNLEGIVTDVFTGPELAPALNGPTARSPNAMSEAS